MKQFLDDYIFIFKEVGKVFVFSAVVFAIIAIGAIPIILSEVFCCAYFSLLYLLLPFYLPFAIVVLVRIGEKINEE